MLSKTWIGFHGLLYSIPSDLDKINPLFDDLARTDDTELNYEPLIILVDTLTKFKNILSALHVTITTKSIEFQQQENAQFISTENKISDLIFFVNSQMDRFKTKISEEKKNRKGPSDFESDEIFYLLAFSVFVLIFCAL